MDDLNVSSEFIEQNKELCQTMPKKKGGRYTKQEITKRQDEVFRLHFDYGYSARKIAELMNVNRNTINNDLRFWYSKIYNKNNIFNPEDVIIQNLERLELQRSRLREKLDKTKSFQEQLSLERMIYDIDCKILHVNQRLGESTSRLLKLNSTMINDWLKKHGKSERVMALQDKFLVSEKAQERITEIIKEDRKRGSIS